LVTGDSFRAMRPTDSRRAGLICPRLQRGTGPGRWSGHWRWRWIRRRTASGRCRELARRKPI